MRRLRPSRPFAGWSALLGGTVWLGHTALLALRPVGCVGAACAEGDRTHRGTEDIAWILLAAVLLLAGSIASHRSRDGGPGRRLQSAALALCGTGGALLVLGLILNARHSTVAPLWWLHDSDALGRLLPVLGTVLFGLSMRRTEAHRWLAAGLVLAGLVGLAFNAQDERTLLSLPLGVAWIAFGLVVLRSSRLRTDGLVARRGGRRRRM